MKHVKYFFLLVGTIMLLGSFNFYSKTQDFLEVAITTKGYIIKLIEVNSSDPITYKHVFEFSTKNGESINITSSSSSNPPSYSVGEAVEVLYVEASPSEAKINSFFSLWAIPIILGVLGSVFFIISSWKITYSNIKEKRIRRLKETGLSILASYQSVELNRSLEINERNPYQIHTQWINPTTSKVHIFKSENIWFNPSEYIVSDHLTVYVDQDNLKKYYVDITFLPGLAN